MAYIVKDRLKKAPKEADREKTLKDVVVVMVKDKGKAAEDVERRAREAKNARVLAEQSLKKKA